MKVVKIILLISKNEAFAMRKLIGEKYVKKSYSKHPSYYLVEDQKAVNELNKYRKSHIMR